MKCMNFRNTLSALVPIGGTLMAASAKADQPQGTYGHGYGMMCDYSPQSNVNLSAEQRGKSWRNGYGMWGK